MKTVTTREFYHNPSLVDHLKAEDALIVTSRGAPKFKVIKINAKKKIYTPEMLKKSLVRSLKPVDVAEFLKEDRS